MATSGERKLDARQQEIREDRLCSRDATLANHLGNGQVDASFVVAELNVLEEMEMPSRLFGTFYRRLGDR